MIQKHTLHTPLTLSLCTLAAGTLVACGGGGASTPPSAQLNGVVAYGAPMAGARVTLTDSNDQHKSTNAASDGSYSLDVTGLTAPFLLQAQGVGALADKQYAALVASAPAAGETARANITPLTHALVTMVSSDGTKPDEFATASTLKALDTAKLSTALSHLQTALQNVLQNAQLPTTFNPLTANFKADRTSAADLLLDTIKVGVSEQGLSLSNVRVPIDSTTGSLTIKGTSTAPTALPAPTISADDLTALDSFVSKANACLALSPSERVSKDNTGQYTFLGACAQVDTFDANNYLNSGYGLSQVWGPRLAAIPAGSTLLPPEFLLFSSSGNTAVARLTSHSAKGDLTYIETAIKTAAGWKIVGNQRRYDAGISVKLARQTDVSTNGWSIPTTFVNSPDKGKNVGNFDAYLSIMYFTFNPMGPNASNVYAVRIKGPGLPDNGIVLSRSSSCGTDRYLAFYSNDGSQPPIYTTNSMMTTTSTGNGWVLDVANFGNAYKGTDFYNQYRGLNSSGSPSTSTSNSVAPQGSVKINSIPDFAQYNWEVFSTTSSTADTFTSRIYARPLPASQGAQQPWANFSSASLAYLDPNNSSKAAALTNATLDWTLPDQAPAVTSGWVYGADANVRMNMGDQVSLLGDTRLALSAATEKNGMGQPCNTSQVPGFTEISGTRTIGLRQSLNSGLGLQQWTTHIGRPAN